MCQLNDKQLKNVIFFFKKRCLLAFHRSAAAKTLGIHPYHCLYGMVSAFRGKQALSQNRDSIIIHLAWHPFSKLVSSENSDLTELNQSKANI